MQLYKINETRRCETKIPKLISFFILLYNWDICVLSKANAWSLFFFVSFYLIWSRYVNIWCLAYTNIFILRQYWQGVELSQQLNSLHAIYFTITESDKRLYFFLKQVVKITSLQVKCWCNNDRKIEHILQMNWRWNISIISFVVKKNYEDKMQTFLQGIFNLQF